MASISTEPRLGPMPPTAIFTLLVEGAKEIRSTGFFGIIYGIIFALMGYAIAELYQQLWQLTIGLMAAFLLMGPFICCGIYDLSRQKENDVKADFWASLICWARNWKSIVFFAAILTFLVIIWVRVSVIVFALFATHSYPDLADMLHKMISMNNIAFLCVWSAVGFVFASLVFAISVVSMPMMLDRGADTLLAVFTSAKTLWENPGAMLVWALTITVLIGGSLVFFLPLLALTAPLIGHTTWKVYKALVPVSVS